MNQPSDINAAKIALIASLGVTVTVAVALVAIVSYFTMADRVEKSRSADAAVRIQREAEAIAAGHPVSQPWLNADLQRATQEAQLSVYAHRIIKQEDGSERITYAIPIEQAMESVLKEAAKAPPAGPHPEEAGP